MTVAVRATAPEWGLDSGSSLAPELPGFADRGDRRCDRRKGLKDAWKVVVLNT